MRFKWFLSSNVVKHQITPINPSIYKIKNYRPDIKYVQGMSYSIVFLLLLMPPHEAFKTFSNIILSSDFLFNTINFKKSYLQNLNRACSDIIRKFNSKMFKFFKKLKIDIWEIFLVEVVSNYAQFLLKFVFFWTQINN